MVGPSIRIVLAGAAIAWAALNWPLPALVAVPMIMWLTIRRWLRPFWQSPVWLVVSVITLVGLFGSISFGAGQISPGFPFSISQATADRTIVIMALSSAATMLGATCYLALRRSRRISGELLPVSVVPRGRMLLLLLALLPLLVAVANVGTLLDRTTYLRGAPGSLIGTLGQMTLVGIVGLGYLTTVSRGLPRAGVRLAALLEWAVLFSLGSRAFAIAPIAFAGGAYARRIHGRPRFLLLTVGLSILLVPVPLYLRGLPTHGLLPYWHSLGALPYNGRALEAALANLLVGFPVTGITAFASPEVHLHDVLVSLNPAPGHLAGWYAIAGRLKISDFFPFSGIGETWNAGVGIALGVWFCIGILLGHLERRVGVLLHKGRQLFALALIALSALFGVVVTQYNLRNATRLLWYAVVVDVASRAVGPAPSRKRYAAPDQT